MRIQVVEFLKARNRPNRYLVLGAPLIREAILSILGELRPKRIAFSLMVELSTRIREARMVIYEVTPWPDPEIPVIDKIPTIDYRKFLSGVRSQSDPAIRDGVPRLALPVLGVRSGGLVLGNSQDLEQDIARCVEDASRFYTVSFDPPHAELPDEYHDLAVLVGTAHIENRTNRSYYNQPVFYDQPRLLSKRLTVAELEQRLTGESGEAGGKPAQELKDVELTERLSSSELSRLQTSLPGKQTQSALIALADSSVFLEPPQAEVPDKLAPDADEQHQILLRTEKYLDDALPKLPDFSADSTTIKYEQPSPGEKDTWKTAPKNRSWLETVSERATFLYRNGHEQRILEQQRGKRKPTQNDLNYKGIFGPIPGFVLEDVRRGNSKLIWSRWERTEQGTLAVFRYSVRAENPRYGVVYCCLVNGRVFETFPEHHGEIAIDAGTGAILRLAVESQPGWIRESNLHPLRPVLLSSMMVEYGPVDIAGTKYICPRRSVVITRERTIRPVHFWDLNFKMNAAYQTLMNDTSYSNYHKFGSELRMLPGFDVVKDGIASPLTNDPSIRER